MTYRVLVTDELSAEAVELLERHADFAFDVVKGLSPAELTAAISDYDGLIVRSSARVTADLIHAGNRLKVIGRAGTGIDNIDVQAANERGVTAQYWPQQYLAARR